MTEYIIRWDGIGTRIVELIREGTPPYLICKRLRAERVHEEIARCGDCIYYKLDPDPIDPGWPMMCECTGADMLEPCGFCAWAVRKEGGDD